MNRSVSRSPSPARVHQLEVRALDPAGAEELLREVSKEDGEGPYDYPAA